MEVTTFAKELERTGRIVYTNKGFSMRPLLREDRDLMIIERVNTLKKYDAVLFERPGIQGRGQYVLHRILKVNPDGTYWIVGDNCVSGEIVKRENIMGILTGVVRNKRTIHVTDFWYRVYVHLWCDVYPVRFFLLHCRNHLARLKRKILKKR